MNNCLAIRDLSVRLRAAGPGPGPGHDYGGEILRGVSFEVPQGAITGLVGGSGSGKTTLGLAVLGLLPEAMERSSGRIIFDGRDITDHAPEQLRALRGLGMSMSFQEPMSAFNPVMTIGAQIAETVLAHEHLPVRMVRERTLAALRSAGIPDPARVAAAYAFELSGGLRQRAMIAQAIVCRPKLLIADEPTSSLDVDTRQKILDLFQELRRALGLSIVLITHDLGVVRRVADEVVVLCQGEVVERGPASVVMGSPRAGYTRTLLEAEGL